ncbi:LegC family aminotransferase [Clostridium neonatale]|uniref:LegC family aminotransferase n=1 Tax=Clostridium neonatale TaxID=137838 RepID=UPI003D35005E
MFIPLSVPNLKGNELKYVTEAIESEWVSTGGSYITTFEQNISKYLNVEMAAACQSGTSAIHLALLESKISSDDEVIVPTLTFIAAVNPVMYCNAHPVFMDCDDSLTLDPEKLNEFCINECEFIDGRLINKKTKRHIKAIVVVHVFGNMADMEKIMDVAKKYNIIVIEDATEALGTVYLEGKYKNKYAGTIGDFGCYSFNGNKIITTGGGGMLVARDKEKLLNAKHISTQAKSDPINYLHDEIGYNYRMTNLQAAVGVAQLEELEKFIEIKKDNYFLYKNLLEDKNNVEILNFRDGVRSNYWFYSLVLKDINSKKTEVIDKLSENRIQTRPIWGLIHEQIPYINCQSYKIDKAKYYFKRVINIPCSSNLSKEQINTVVVNIKEIV